LTLRGWRYFENFYLNRVNVDTGPPKVLAQQALGAGIGTLWFYPMPDQAYTVRLYPICLPIDLVVEADAEALPMPWQEVVPYYAAYFTYLATGAIDVANDMWKRYQLFQDRANAQATGLRLPQNYPVFRPSTPQEKAQ
jgi:hypothetical protein